MILPTYVMYILLYAMKTLPMHALNDSMSVDVIIMKKVSWTLRSDVSPMLKMNGATTDSMMTIGISMATHLAMPITDDVKVLLTASESPFCTEIAV